MFPHNQEVKGELLVEAVSYVLHSCLTIFSKATCEIPRADENWSTLAQSISVWVILVVSSMLIREPHGGCRVP